MGDPLGDRMKDNYENRARHYLIRRMPVIVRVDGKAFHTYTAGMEKPFDRHILSEMARSARMVAEHMQGCKAVYVQSDEASFLLTDYDHLNTEAWFDYNKSKIETIAAATMSVAFNRSMSSVTNKLAVFDARAFNIPREEVANYFLWRAKDWERNSVAMYCSAFYSHKEMHGQGRADQHEMLHAKGKNWTTDLTEQQKNGTFILRYEVGFNTRCDIEPVFSEIDEALDSLVNCDRELS